MCDHVAQGQRYVVIGTVPLVLRGLLTRSVGDLDVALEPPEPCGHPETPARFSYGYGPRRLCACRPSCGQHRTMVDGIEIDVCKLHSFWTWGRLGRLRWDDLYARSEVLEGLRCASVTDALRMKTGHFRKWDYGDIVNVLWRGLKPRVA